MSKQTFYIEVTDTFGGETNYCWIRRYAVKAKTERGAMRVIGNHEEVYLRCDGWRWNFKDAAICAYVVDSEIPDDEVVRYEKLN